MQQDISSGRQLRWAGDNEKQRAQALASGSIQQMEWLERGGIQEETLPTGLAYGELLNNRRDARTGLLRGMASLKFVAP